MSEQHTSKLSVLDGTVDFRFTIHSRRLQLSIKKASTSSEESAASMSSASTAACLFIAIARGGWGIGTSCWSGRSVSKRDSRICTTQLCRMLLKGKSCTFNQRQLSSRNIGWVTPKINYCYYLKESFLDRSIQKIFYLNLNSLDSTSVSQRIRVLRQLSVRYSDFVPRN